MFTALGIAPRDDAALPMRPSAHVLPTAESKDPGNAGVLEVLDRVPVRRLRLSMPRYVIQTSRQRTGVVVLTLRSPARPSADACIEMGMSREPGVARIEQPAVRSGRLAGKPVKFGSADLVERGEFPALRLAPAHCG
jgi:hypothetical protein